MGSEADAVCEEWRVYVRYHAHQIMLGLVRRIARRHMHPWGRSEAEARRVLRPSAAVQQSGLTEMLLNEPPPPRSYSGAAEESAHSPLLLPTTTGRVTYPVDHSISSGAFSGWGLVAIPQQAQSCFLN